MADVAAGRVNNRLEGRLEVALSHSVTKCTDMMLFNAVAVQDLMIFQFRQAHRVGVAIFSIALNQYAPSMVAKFGIIK